MGISGSLKDVSVADVMQFIHLGRRTGTLELSRGRERAMVGFHCGRLVSAQAPRTPKLGDLLVDTGLIDRDTLDQAISAQNHGLHRSLGQILTESGKLDAERLRDMISRQIEQAISEVLLWETGSFDFAIDDLRPIDDIAIYPSDVLPDIDINTQMVLLEAARIFDERSREGAVEGTETGPVAVIESEPAPESEVARPTADLEIHLVSSDEVLLHRLAAPLERRFARVRRVDLLDAGRVVAGESDPVVLVDLRRGTLAPERAERIHDVAPRSSLIAVVDTGTPLAAVYGAGFLAALPAEVDAVIACVDNLLDNRRDATRRGLERGDLRDGVARLRRVYGDLRSGLISATVALNLMHIVSESVERAILFLVKRDHLVALGAFGQDASGRPLAERSRGLKIDLADGSALTLALDSGEVQARTFETADLPPALAALLGRPKSGQTVVFPVLGSQRVIAAIYADNGDRDHPIEDIDILELATAQVGMAFENELLRRQIPTGPNSN